MTSRNPFPDKIGVGRQLLYNTYRGNNFVPDFETARPILSRVKDAPRFPNTASGYTLAISPESGAS